MATHSITSRQTSLAPFPLNVTINLIVKVSRLITHVVERVPAPFTTAVPASAEARAAPTPEVGVVRHF